jgi:hypothetical protein
MQHQILDNGWSSLPPTILPMLRYPNNFPNLGLPATFPAENPTLDAALPCRCQILLAQGSEVCSNSLCQSETNGAASRPRWERMSTKVTDISIPGYRLISLFGLAHAFGLTLHLGSSGSGLMGEVRRFNSSRQNTSHSQTASCRSELELISPSPRRLYRALSLAQTRRIWSPKNSSESNIHTIHEQHGRKAALQMPCKACDIVQCVIITGK